MDAVGGSWAGTLTCSECRRKRLTGESFSGKQLAKLREGKLAEDKLKCKECTLKAATEERERASQNSKRGSSGAEGKGEPLSCSVCKQGLPAASFTNTQARKPDASRKCRDCSASAEAAEAEALRVARAAKMSEAQAASASAAQLPKGAAGAAARLKGEVTVEAKLPVRRLASHCIAAAVAAFFSVFRPGQAIIVDYVMSECLCASRILMVPVGGGKVSFGGRAQD